MEVNQKCSYVINRSLLSPPQNFGLLLQVYIPGCQQPGHVSFQHEQIKQLSEDPARCFVSEHVLHDRKAVVLFEVMLMFEAFESSFHHRVFKEGVRLHLRNGYGKPLRNAEVLCFPGHGVIQFEQTGSAACDHFFIRVRKGIGVRFYRTREIEADVRAGVDFRFQPDYSHAAKLSR